MNGVTGFSILFALVGLLFIGLSIPLILKKVPPNWIYRYRTKKTLSSPIIRYEANHVFGKDFLISGLLTFIAALAVLVLGQGADPNHAVITLLSVLVLSLAGAALHSFKNVRRM
ncbi:MAG TPA: SdpI family protein [Pyrinomonadaceae bacterium]|nr:SdpI family protein [Pyrinomonadaceae bacterium]